MGDRVGDWMQTYTGKRFYPLDPRPEDVCIADIAHALSLVARFGGHTREFYSVAQHSVAVVSAVEPGYMKWALLHDAAEAYVGDIVGPLKRSLPEYKAAEKRVLRCVAERFGLARPMPAEVREADLKWLRTEKQLFADDLEWKYAADVLPYVHKIVPLPPAEAERLFLNVWEVLNAAEC